MLRVRTVISGFVGGPGLLTQYFLTPLEDAAAATRCVSYVRSLWDSALSGVMPTGVSFQISGDVDVITSQSGVITNTLSVGGGAPFVGKGGVSTAPPVLAGLLQLRTSTFIAGRRVQGRIFVSPMGAAQIASDGLLTNPGQTGIAGAFAFLEPQLAAGDTWVVWHRPKLGVGGQAVPITSSSTPFKLAVLTSRRD